MEQVTNSFGVAQGFVGDHSIAVQMLLIVTVAMTLLLAVWSLLRRRGVRRLAHMLRDTQRRLEALERAEHDRTLRRIVAPDQPST